MVIFRFISLSVHGLAEMVAGLVLLAAPLLVDLGSLGTVVVVCAGFALVGLALFVVDQERGLPVRTQFLLDWTLTLAFAIAAISLVLAADGPGAVAIGIATAVLAVLNTITSYSGPANVPAGACRERRSHWLSHAEHPPHADQHVAVAEGVALRAHRRAAHRVRTRLMLSRGSLRRAWERR
jgi:hypothetical protein